MNKSLTHCILLTSSWQNTLRQEAALDFCNNLLNSKHKIHTLFLQHDAVNIANVLNITPDEESDITAKWHNFIAKHTINAHICINSALKRGVIDANMAKQYKKPCANLSPLFKLSSLGTFFDALQSTDKFVQL